MGIESEAVIGVTRQPKSEKTTEPDNLHSGAFLSGQKLALADGSSNFEPQVRSGERGSSGDSALPTLILLKEQKNDTARKEQVDKVAGELASYIKGAHKTLDIAIYHFQLSGNADDKTSPMGQVVAALNDRAEHGVKIRLAIFRNPQKGAKADDAEESGKAAAAQNTSEPGKLNTNVTGLDPRISVAGIDGGGKLMHSKYVIRDGATNDGAVWTGSTNFTDEAFGSQDNNIIQLKSEKLASVYAQDFQQMWDSQKIAKTGKGLHQSLQIGDSSVTVAFSPGDGAFIDNEIAQRIENAKQSVHIASMDISSQKVLQALADKIDQGKQVTGIYDGPQMNVVAKGWERSGSETSQAKVALWNKVKEHLVEKHSKPFKPGTLSNFMHDKTVAVDSETQDGIVITGSFNFSNNATHNAENIVEIANQTVAKQYSDYVNDLVITYGVMLNKGKSK